MTDIDTITSATEEPANDSEFDRILRVLDRIERQYAVMRADTKALYATVVQVQRDVNFFTRRCEERGTIIREYVAQIHANGGVSEELALEFLYNLECAGSPARSPSSDGHTVVPCSAVQLEDLEGEGPTQPGASTK